MKQICFILSLLIISIGTINAEKTEVDYYTVAEYKVYSKDQGLMLTGLELVQENQLDPKKDYPQAVAKIIKENNFKKSKHIIDILRDKTIFDKYKNYFTPFDTSSLTQIIYQGNRALVSFGYNQDEYSIVFGDFLLELNIDQIEIYQLSSAVGCNDPVEPVEPQDLNKTSH